MIAMLLLAAATPQTALGAERAFAAAAQSEGQWTAFREFAAPDAVMFVPQPANAQTFLKDKRDPHRSVAWSPTASYVACDGMWAVNTGEWHRPDGSAGYFSTVWRRGSDRRWRWMVDSGDGLNVPRAAVARPLVRHAACGGKGRGAGFGSEGGSGYGASNDATLRWRWHVDADGARTFRAELWNGRAYDIVIDDRIAADK